MKSHLLLYILILFISCNQDIALDDAKGMDIISLEIKMPSSQILSTKAFDLSAVGLPEKPKWNKINKIFICVVRSTDGAVDAISGGTLSEEAAQQTSINAQISVTRGMRDIYVIANPQVFNPADVNEPWAVSVKNEEDLMNLQAKLENQQPYRTNSSTRPPVLEYNPYFDGHVMTGQKYAVNIELSNNPVQVILKPIVTRVEFSFTFKKNTAPDNSRRMDGTNFAGLTYTSSYFPMYPQKTGLTRLEAKQDFNNNPYQYNQNLLSGSDYVATVNTGTSFWNFGDYYNRSGQFVSGLFNQGAYDNNWIDWDMSVVNYTHNGIVFLFENTPTGHPTLQNTRFLGVQSNQNNFYPVSVTPYGGGYLQRNQNYRINLTYDMTAPVDDTPGGTGKNRTPSRNPFTDIPYSLSQPPEYKTSTKGHIDRSQYQVVQDQWMK